MELDWLEQNYEEALLQEIDDELDGDALDLHEWAFLRGLHKGN